MPDAWLAVVGVLTRIAGRDGTWAAVPIPFLVRLPCRGRARRLGRPDGPPLDGARGRDAGLPALWYGGLSMLLAVIALREPVAPARAAGRASPQALTGPA